MQSPCHTNLFDRLGTVPSLVVLLLLIPGTLAYALDSLFAYPIGLVLNVVIYKKSAHLVALFLPRECHHEQQQYPSRQCRVLSLNAFLRVVGTNHDHSDLKDDRLDEIIKIIPSFDVICLQEVVAAMSTRRNALILAARKLGFRHCVSPPGTPVMSCHFIDSGCMILSRFAISRRESCVFRDYCGVDQLCAKGVLYAQINPNSHSTLHIFNTHLQSFYSLSDQKAHATQRLQIHQLVQFDTDENTAHVPR